MTDQLSKAARSALMARIGSKNTAPELAVRRAIFSLGYRFRLQRRNLPGTPDVVLASSKVAVFTHGCFWHGHRCRRGRLPKSNVAYWSAKISKNKLRDRLATKELRRLGWRPIVVWECWTRDSHVLTSKLGELVPRRKAG